MFKKIIIGVLLVTVIGAAGAAWAYHAANQDNQITASTPNPLANAQVAGTSEQAQQGQAPQRDANTQGEPVAQGMQGEPWQATGIITAVDEYGFNLTLEDGKTIYIELGPPDFWQSQGVELIPGQTAIVTGSINEDMIHASQVELADNQILQVRNESGQPLWSGGATNGQGQNGQTTGSENGSHTPDPQAQVDEWITIEGTLMAFQGGNMTMSTADGAIISFQTGQPRFFAEQGITFQVGDQISVLGFYESDQFTAGEITQLSTGLRVMLRDPNGRPLWAGPGGNGNGSSGNGGNGNGGSRGNSGPQG